MRRVAALSIPILALVACQAEKGDPGAPGQSVSASAVPVGDAHCAHGGARLVSADGTAYACNGAPGTPGTQGPPGELRVRDGNGALLGTFLATSPAYQTQSSFSNGALTSVSIVPFGQLVTYRDDDGLVWNVGMGGGTAVQPRFNLYYEAADCSGEPFVASMSPDVPGTFFAPPDAGGPPTGVYRPLEAIVPAPAPLGYWAWGAPDCVTPPPPPAYAMNVVYRAVVRIADGLPIPPRTPPLSIVAP